MRLIVPETSPGLKAGVAGAGLVGIIAGKPACCLSVAPGIAFCTIGDNGGCAGGTGGAAGGAGGGGVTGTGCC